MDARAKAVMLADYLKSLDGFVLVDYIDGNYRHMGAIIVDAILQAGINYDAVVRPRIKRIREVYPAADTTSEFWKLLHEKGSKTVLSWNDDEKPNRVVRLTEFFLKEGIETEQDLHEWIANDSNRDRLLELPGVGSKTADFIKILVGLQTAAVDRHVDVLLAEAGMKTSSYEEAREVLNLAADIFGTERAFFDNSVWRYMSHRENQRSSTSPCDKHGKAEV
jgi:endonuclease III